jgi:hypothetical protein
VAKIKGMLKIWFKNKVLAKEKRVDGSGHKRQFIVPGPFVAESDGDAVEEVIPEE